MTLSMQFDASGVRDSPLSRFSWAKAATAWADDTGPLVRDALKEKAPLGKGLRAGRLRDAIRYERQTGLGSGSVVLRFEANVPYTPFVLKGTRPHLISASAARALHWQGAGGDVFAKRVNHPGTRANRFNERAVVPLAAVLEERFRAAIEASMEGL